MTIPTAVASFRKWLWAESQRVAPSYSYSPMDSYSSSATHAASWGRKCMSAVVKSQLSLPHKFISALASVPPSPSDIPRKPSFLMSFPPDSVIRVLRYSARFPLTAFKDLKQDLKSTRWLRGLGWSAGVIWFFGLVVSAVLMGIVALFRASDTACQPDGSFRLLPDTYSMWSSTGFFQITLGGGKLTFAQAKVLDIVWDIVSRSGNSCTWINTDGL